MMRLIKINSNNVNKFVDEKADKAECPIISIIKTSFE